MESNKDEAIRCVEIGITWEEKGDFDRAIKFYQKSISLYPTTLAKSRLETAQTRRKQDNSNTSTSSSDNNNSTAHSASSRPETTKSTKSTIAEREYTPEQKAIADRINKCKDYYEILDVSKSATDVEISKKYKKIALQLHPDKNGAPGAEDAFKKVGQAFSCLSDPSKRRMYDVRGVESDSHPSPSRHHEYDGDVTADEIFEMFFGGGLNRRRGTNQPFRTYTYQFGGTPRHHQTQAHARHARAAQHQQADSFGGLILALFQFLPFLVLFLYAFLGGSSSSSSNQHQYFNQAYSLKETDKFNQLRKTAQGIPFYVARSFDRQFGDDAAEIQEEVDQVWLLYKRRECHTEQSNKYDLWQRYLYYRGTKRGSDILKQYESFKTPACDELKARGFAID